MPTIIIFVLGYVVGRINRKVGKFNSTVCIIWSLFDYIRQQKSRDRMAILHRLTRTERGTRTKKWRDGH